MDTGAIELSLNEVEAQAMKAARGAGLPWGAAEEAGRAARWLAGHGFDWAPALLGLLGTPTAATVLAAALRLADGLAGSAADEEREAGDCVPLWSLAVLALRARTLGTALAVRWPGLVVRIEADGAVSLDRPAQIVPGALPGTARLAVGPGSPEAFPLGLPAVRSRVRLSDWRAIGALAALTYVPASALSRETGAGAGLTDND
ncbi:DUF3726 domain-containing protein [Labrys wisconsinensis]|uniref:DUF3726 domain-containing protein n=1 Tax=Labrys wisconsinensis TaxID=425677 RepID=A0ABU0J4M4_9HYPH|nr:DUF3726 domain-containing protein [Labrys wisconsinensis]MDQ0469218.1 hypothetical protein [Labrys wisconsinensis]